MQNRGRAKRGSKRTRTIEFNLVQYAASVLTSVGTDDDIAIYDRLEHTARIPKSSQAGVSASSL